MFSPITAKTDSGRKGPLCASEIETKRNSGTYHRFVKTTPKPRATKKRRGELVALFELELPPLPLVEVALAVAEVEVEDIVDGQRSGKKGDEESNQRFPVARGYSV